MGHLLPDTPILSFDEYVRERDGGAGIEAARTLRSDGTIAELLATGLQRVAAAPASRPVASGSRSGPVAPRRDALRRGERRRRGSRVRSRTVR